MTSTRVARFIAGNTGSFINLTDTFLQQFFIYFNLNTKKTKKNAFSHNYIVMKKINGLKYKNLGINFKNRIYK